MDIIISSTGIVMILFNQVDRKVDSVTFHSLNLMDGNNHLLFINSFVLWLFLRQVCSATSQLNASQGAIINTSHSIRLILDDLKAVSEKIDIITSCQILPDININNPNNHTEAVP